MYYMLIGTEEYVKQTKDNKFESTFAEVEIAVFDKKHLAEKYIEKSKLKNPKKMAFSADVVFKQSSKLRFCVNARVEQCHPFPELEMNPK